MKIDIIKIENYARLAMATAFVMLAIIGAVAICFGKFGHFLTVSGSLVMVYYLLKKW